MVGDRAAIGSKSGIGTPMNFDLTEEQQLFADAVRKFAVAELGRMRGRTASRRRSSTAGAINGGSGPMRRNDGMAQIPPLGLRV
jgi:hypothetical protein